MFYDNFKYLCDINGEKPYSLALKLGAKHNSVVDQWKKGSVPRKSMLSKIAEYFNVSIDYLLTGEEKQTDAYAGLSEEALMIAKIVDALPPEHRRLLLALVQELASAPADPASSPKSE